VREIVVSVVIVVVCVVVVCGFRTSSRCMWISAIEPLYVDVGHRAVICECRPSYRCFFGEVLPKFLIDSIIFLSFFAEKSPLKRSRSTPIVFLSVAGLPAPRCLATAPTRHGSTILTPPSPRYNPFPYHSRSSRNSVRRLSFERDTIIGMQIFTYL
jgi:hypothetical protein